MPTKTGLQGAQRKLDIWGVGPFKKDNLTADRCLEHALRALRHGGDC